MIGWGLTDVTLEGYSQEVNLNLYVSETLHVPESEIHSHFQFGDNTGILFGNLSEIIYA